MDSIQIHTESFGITANYLRILNNFLHSNTLRIFVPEKIKKRSKCSASPQRSCFLQQRPHSIESLRMLQFPWMNIAIPIHSRMSFFPPCLPRSPICLSLREWERSSSDLYPLPYVLPQRPVPGLVYTPLLGLLYILVPINTPQPGALSNNGLVLHPPENCYDSFLL